MKNFKLFYLLPIFLLLIPVVSLAQSSTTMQDILETVNSKVIELEDEKGQEVVNITIDLLVGNGSKSFWRYLDPSFSYDVIAFGDRRIKTLKLTIYRKSGEEWELVNEHYGSRPQIRVEPLVSEQYSFSVAVEEFNKSNFAGHFSVLLYHRNPELSR